MLEMEILEWFVQGEGWRFWQIGWLAEHMHWRSSPHFSCRNSLCARIDCFGRVDLGFSMIAMGDSLIELKGSLHEIFRPHDGQKRQQQQFKRQFKRPSKRRLMLPETLDENHIREYSMPNKSTE
jgi:hypothetical protein